MSHSYVAYIDESGDDGMANYREPGQSGGSSSWLIISACVIRASRDRQAVGWRDEILSRMPERQSRDLHFTKLNHGQKVVTAQCLVQHPLRAISIVSSKRTAPEDTFHLKNQLYFYTTRYLIERISWMCRDYRRLVREGDGRVKIIFSRRGGMSYPDFRAYLLRLQNDATVRIHWPAIDVDRIEALDHSRRAALQIADAIASAFAGGIEVNRYGNCEARYAEILKPAVYCRNENYLSYGVKLVPPIEELQLSNDQMRFINLFR
jgi:hypothetical protein